MNSIFENPGLKQSAGGAALAASTGTVPDPAIAVSLSIRRVLRHQETGHYFTGTGWTADPIEARVFEDVLDAARVCVDCNLSNVELVLQRGEAETELFGTPIR